MSPFQLSTCFLAWTTWHVNVPSVNDIRGIRFSVFVSVLVIFTGLYASMLFQDQPNVQFCIVALVIVTCSLSTLCMLFVPKVWGLRSVCLSVSLCIFMSMYLSMYLSNLIGQILIIRMGPTSLPKGFHLTQWHKEIEPENNQHCREKDFMKQRNTGASGYVTDIKQNISATMDILLSDNQRLQRRVTKVRTFFLLLQYITLSLWWCRLFKNVYVVLKISL